MDERLEKLKSWLNEELGVPALRIEPASEDASFRRYFRVSTKDGSLIVMDAPPDKEDCNSFVDVTSRLLDCDLNVPEIVARNHEQGFLLLSDLGERLYLDELSLENADDLYGDAIQALITMQTQASTRDLPEYSESLLQKEMSLFRTWLMDRHLGLGEDLISRLESVEAFLLNEVLVQPKVFVHRDFHSRNLLVCENNPGIIDYQDAVYGPYTYDLVSLLKDSYITWSMEKRLLWTQVFHRKLSEANSAIPDLTQFKRDFDLMGAQRQLKVGGIFARLYHRDGKSGYLNDIPATLNYLLELQNAYPELEELGHILQSEIMPRLQELA